ncbi:MAG TPA: hypothetical protein VKY36_02585 [Moheibacter sp.]|nr:hypothetical protein [Moheibacter sp.]
MKKIVIVLMFWPLLGWGQFFDNNADDQNLSDSGTSHFSDKNTNSGNDDAYDNPNYVDPDMGLDSAGGPGNPVPIDNWIFFLPLAGIAIGAFYLSRRKTEVS